MGRFKVTIDDQMEERFRKAAKKKFGQGTGALGMAVETTLDEWTSKVECQLGFNGITDPANSIEGVLNGVRGSTSVKLQHEASTIRARKK